MNLTTSVIAKYVDGIKLSSKGEMMVTNCVIDSRKAVSNSLFIPFKGERVNGYDYIRNAVENGSSCIFIEDERYFDRELPCEFILVKDNVTALQQLASNYRNGLNLKVIGVTGSNGKTTTKDLVATVTSVQGKTLKTQGNLNNHLGLPLTLLNCDESHEFAVLEMGMSQLGEIDVLSKIAKPDIGIITNIGESHLENLKTKENIAKAKGEIFNHLKPDGLGILNGDDPYLTNLINTLPKVITYGLRENNQLYATNIHRIGNSTVFQVKGLGIDETIHLPLLGEHNVYNCLAAIAVGLNFGIHIRDIKESLLDLQLTGMRTEILSLNEITLINDCYNASETSTKAALKVLGDLGKGKIKIAFLGDMLELGDYTEQAHFNVGKEAALIGVEKIITVGQYGKYIKSGALNAGFKGEFLSFSNSQQGREYIKDIIIPGATVLVKGSRGIKMEQIVERIKEEF